MMSKKQREVTLQFDGQLDIYASHTGINTTIQLGCMYRIKLPQHKVKAYPRPCIYNSNIQPILNLF